MHQGRLLTVLAVMLAALMMCVQGTVAQHQWLPLRIAYTHQGYLSTWSARQLLYSVRMQMKDGWGTKTGFRHEENYGWNDRLPIFVIGLKHREKERLANFLLKLRWYEDLHVVEAVDGRTLDHNDNMTSGEIACFQSHRKAWKKIVDEELRQAIIMEDDAEVDMSLNMDKVKTFLNDAPQDWQLLYLGINNYLDVRNVTASVAEPLRFIRGTHAYVVRGMIAARLHALSEIPPYEGAYNPVDMWLTKLGLKIYIINPPLVKQRNFGDTDTQGIRTKTINTNKEPFH